MDHNKNINGSAITAGAGAIFVAGLALSASLTIGYHLGTWISVSIFW